MEDTIVPIIDRHNANLPRSQRIAKGRTMQDLVPAIMKIPQYEVKLNQEYAARVAKKGTIKPPSIRSADSRRIDSSLSKDVEEALLGSLAHQAHR